MKMKAKASLSHYLLGFQHINGEKSAKGSLFQVSTVSLLGLVGNGATCWMKGYS